MQSVAANPIDGYFQIYSPNKKGRLFLSDDLTFIRRIYLDLTGRLPEKARIESFVADSSPSKRAALIDEILQSEDYTMRLTAFLEDLFWNQTLVFPPYYRNSFNQYLNTSLEYGLTWKEIATDILTFRGGGYYNPKEEDYTTGSPFIFWAREGLFEEFRLDYLDDQVNYITRSMLGITTECISCHDGANHLEEVNVGLTHMKREQFWGMAALLARTHYHLPRHQTVYNTADPEVYYQDLKVVDLDAEDFDVDRGSYVGYRFRNPAFEYVAESETGDGMRTPRTGGTAQPRYLFSGAQPLEGETRRDSLARMLTEDRQFARNMVNRMWAHFFGEGFVNPLNGFDLGRISPDVAAQYGHDVQARDFALMEKLTDLFIAENYDFKALTRVITSSFTYQVDYAKRPFHQVQSGSAWWTTDRRVRRLDAESIVDGIMQTIEQEQRYVVTGMPSKVMRSTWQMPDDEEPAPYALSISEDDGSPVDLGFRSEFAFFESQQGTRDMLNILGRAVRVQFTERDSSATIPTALTLFNESTIHDAIFVDNENLRGEWINRLSSGLSSGTMTETEVVQEMFRYFLFRAPNDMEQAVTLQYFSARQPLEAVQDIAWAMINHPDFLYK